MINIDWTIGLQFANFLVLMAVLNFLLYRPLRDILDRRKSTVDGSYQKAKALETQIQDKMAAYEQKVQEAKAKGVAEKNALRQAAAKEEAAILGKAHNQAAERLDDIKKQVVAEAVEARAALKKETSSLAADIASKVLGREL